MNNPIPDEFTFLRPMLIQIPSGGEKHIELVGAPYTASLQSGCISLQQGESMELHNSGEHEELLITLSGRGEFRSPGMDPLSIHSGCILYNPPHTAHEVINTGDQVLRYIYVVSKVS